MQHIANRNVLSNVIEKFVLAYINLTSYKIKNPDGNALPALSNLCMGYVFEELIHKSNADSNAEAGKHFTAREVINRLVSVRPN